MHQGVPVLATDPALHSAQAERGAGHAQLAQCAAELWHERHLAAHPLPALPHQLPEVGLPAIFCS